MDGEREREREYAGNGCRDSRRCWNSLWITSGPQLTMLAPSLAPAHHEDLRIRLAQKPSVPRHQTAPEQTRIAKGHAQYLIDTFKTSRAHSQPQSIMGTPQNARGIWNSLQALSIFC
ncbi:hypothetical protein QQF64_035604 [Cirrhinus molitorella]|uniref:Uncharacterized protein n=1 Tax=Cirrhinus molitorella TaxID=172907 RepID=A0ABR3NG99_9TELE